MHEEVKSFINYISPTPEEHEVREMVIATIRHAIQRSWPDARVSPFGSYETKLYLPLGLVIFMLVYMVYLLNDNSDIDLVVQSAEMERHEKKSVLYNLAQLLRHANIADNVSVIGKARVPIIKFVTSYGKTPFIIQESIS
jgi:non-canonical poly(A) RNA polymerase PAPD5/7